jgi:hypothetical protein
MVQLSVKKKSHEGPNIPRLFVQLYVGSTCHHLQEEGQTERPSEYGNDVVGLVRLLTGFVR